MVCLIKLMHSNGYIRLLNISVEFKQYNINGTVSGSMSIMALMQRPELDKYYHQVMLLRNATS